MKNFTRFTLLSVMLMTCGAAFALPQDISVSPVPGSVLEEISSFTVSSGWLDKNYGNTSPQIMINGKSYDVTMDFKSNFDVEFTLVSPVTAPGSYTVIIEENAFTVGWEGDPSPLIEFSYTVENDNEVGDDPGKDEVKDVVPQGYTFFPAAGAEVEVLSSFSVTAELDLFLTAASRKCSATINGTRVDALTTTSGDYGNTLTWELAKPINTPGYYTIYIPEGSFYGYSEEDNKAFMVTVKVTGGDLPEPVYFSGDVTSDPENGSVLRQLDKIAVMYPKLTSAYIGPEASGVMVSDANGQLDVPFTLTPDEDDFNEAHVIWLEFASPITANGDYVITFPAQAFEIAKYPGNWYSAPFTLNFKVSDESAISDVDADVADAPAEYFTTGGVKVSVPATPGIYLRRIGDTVEKVVIR